MLRRESVITLGILLLSIGGLLFHILNFKGFALPIAREKMVSDSLLIKQRRRGVQKDLWISQKGGYSHHRIVTPYSTLTIRPRENLFELIEEMEKVTCYLQKRIDGGKEGSQQIQRLQSDRGRYFYKDQSFDAEKVLITSFKIPGQTLEVDLDRHAPFLRGYAKRAFISLKRDPLNLQAEQFKAHIYCENPL